MDNLINQAKKHNADAFTELMQSQMQTMYKTARSFLSSDEDIADAIQDTILTCWEKLHQLRENRYFRTWMTRILINKCHDILRQKKTVIPVETLPETPAPDLGFANLEWTEALNILDEDHRIVIILYYVEGFKTSEIAAILDIPESTVRNRLARSRKKLGRDYYPEIIRRQMI